MLSASPSQVFPHKVHNIRFEKQSNKDHQCESSTRISKFYDLTDSEDKFHQTRIENWQSIGFKVEFL